MWANYLVIWQLGNNDQSKHETPVSISKGWYLGGEENKQASVLYKQILDEVKNKTGMDNINVLGVYRL